VSISIDSKLFDKLTEVLREYGVAGVSDTIAISAVKLKAMLQKNIDDGKDSDGRVQKLVKFITLELPIKYGEPYKDERVRKSVNSDPRPIKATGRTRNSLKVEHHRATRMSDVYYDDERTELIIKTNAVGRGGKPKRDPFGVSKTEASGREMDLVVEQIEKDLERLLNGI
jgi:hypothetical protein